MTVDKFTDTINELAEVIKIKPPQEAENIIIDTLEKNPLDRKQISSYQYASKEDIQRLQQNLNLVLQFAVKSKESIKSQLQDIKKFHKARDSYNNHSGL